MKKNHISISDFNFQFKGRGEYIVSFISRKTGMRYKNVTNHMPLIDATKNADEPKIKDLNWLKKVCKMGH